MAGRYYRTVIVVEVLSDAPIGFGGIEDLENLGYQVVKGDYSGQASVRTEQKVGPKKMARLLKAQGSDPSFLLGEEWEENPDA